MNQRVAKFASYIDGQRDAAEKQLDGEAFGRRKSQSGAAVQVLPHSTTAQLATEINHFHLYLFILVLQGRRRRWRRRRRRRRRFLIAVVVTVWFDVIFLFICNRVMCLDRPAHLDDLIVSVEDKIWFQIQSGSGFYGKNLRLLLRLNRFESCCRPGKQKSVGNQNGISTFS